MPATTPEKQKAVERLVDHILAAKQRIAGKDVSALEPEIDELVYALCGLTAEEIKIVEGRWSEYGVGYGSQLRRLGQSPTLKQV